MIRALKNKWMGISDEGLFEAVQDCLTVGAGLQTSEFTVDLVPIKPDPKFISDEADHTHCYIHTVSVNQKQRNADH